MNKLIDTAKYIDIGFTIAVRKAAPLTMGSGLIFNCEKEQDQAFIDKWLDDNQVFMKLYQHEILNSIVGRAHIYLVRTKGTPEHPEGNLSIRVPSQSMTTRVAMVDEIEQVAHIYTMPNQSDVGILQEIILKPGTMEIREFHGNTEKLRIDNITAEVMKGLELDSVRVIETGIDMLPIVESTNLPIPAIHGQASTLKAWPDTIAATQLIADVQDNIQKKRSERDLNRTRFYGNISQEELRRVAIEGDRTTKKLITDGYLNSSSNSYSSVGSNGLGIDVVQGDPKFDQYILDQENTLKLIYSSAGYDYDSFNGSNYTNKTESLMNNRLDSETTAVKQAYRKAKFYKIFDYVFIFYGLWDGKGPRPYSFDFKPAMFVDKLKQNDIINSRLENGTITRVSAIAQLDGISENQAQIILDNIADELKEYQEVLDPIGDQEEAEGTGDEVVDDKPEENAL